MIIRINFCSLHIAEMIHENMHIIATTYDQIISQCDPILN